MSQGKKVMVGTSGDSLSGQVADLSPAKFETLYQRLSRIDCIRLFTSRDGVREMVKEVPVSAVLSEPVPVVLLEKGLRKTSGPGIRASLTFDEDGTISFDDTEIEAALAGEDVSALEAITPVDAPSGEFGDPETDDFVSAQAIANELGVDKTTITRRIKNNKLLGYQGFKRDWLIPRAQFKDDNVVPGVAEMIKLFDNEHREAWFFLSSKFFYGDDNPRPIDRLRALRRNDKDKLEACLAELESVKSGHDHGDHF